MRSNLSIISRAMILAAVLLRSSHLWADDLSLHVIVHPTRAGSVTVGEVRAIFLKQQRFWGDGQPIVPVNRGADSEVRERFSHLVFGQSSRQLATYWNRRYFDAGEFPPATLASEEAVLRYVAANENAIGYVARTTDGEVSVVLRLNGTASTESQRGSD
jgi:hypothetical protein